ncbi:hypothetical protein ACWEPN_22160 [Nonomuraea wenchangensis]
MSSWDAQFRGATSNGDLHLPGGRHVQGFGHVLPPDRGLDGMAELRFAPATSSGELADIEAKRF